LAVTLLYFFSILSDTPPKIHLGRDFSQAEQQGWQYVMRFFNSVVSRYLFSQTNVIAIRDRTAHLHSC
ncbi:hypothetical protein, partial [Pseudoalteromonas sp.]|uniref:hypothetical protein n=1 Tax=Pseudoalteromonas sp. TaxID=53249 RepID=UPI003F9607D2